MKKILFEKMLKISQPLLFVFAVAIILFGLSFMNCGVASAETPQESSTQQTEEDYIKFVIDSGIRIPEEFEDTPALNALIKSIVESVEENPNCVFPFSYTVTQDFAESIRSYLVNASDSILYNNKKK